MDNTTVTRSVPDGTRVVDLAANRYVAWHALVPTVVRLRVTDDGGRGWFSYGGRQYLVDPALTLEA